MNRSETLKEGLNMASSHEVITSLDEKAGIFGNSGYYVGPPCESQGCNKGCCCKGITPSHDVCSECRILFDVLVIGSHVACCEVYVVVCL